MNHYLTHMPLGSPLVQPAFPGSLVVECHMSESVLLRSVGQARLFSLGSNSI